MKTNKTNIYLILIWVLISPRLIAQCGITSPTPNPPINIFNSFALQYVSQRVVHIQAGNFMTQDIKFENCEIYLDSDYIYNNATTPIPLMEFINCKIFVRRGFRGSTTNTIQGFIPMPVQLVFDGCCFLNMETNLSNNALPPLHGIAEILHIETGGLVFINNTVDITDAPHMFHLKNMNLSLDNRFYGNEINYKIEEGVYDWDAVIQVDQKNGTIKIGDEYQAKNIFIVDGAIIRDFTSNDGLEVVKSDFNTNYKAIDFDQDFNTISIHNCNFDGTNKNGIAISINKSKNLTVSGNNFEDEDVSILLYNNQKEVNVSNNTFTSNKTAIKSAFANQSLAQGDIISNTFTGNSIDIHSTGAWQRLDVNLNNFSGQQYGILADGDNKYNIDLNTFYNSYAGSILYSNGDNENLHVQNQFNTIIGVHSLNQNEQYEFLDNCFSSTGGDVYIDGSVMSQIGSQDKEAGNCFTKQGIPDISATGTSFEYYRPDSKINTCSDPATTGSTYIEKDAAVSQDLLCGSGMPYTGPVYNYCNFNIKTITCGQAKILANQILQQIIFIKNSNQYNNAAQKEYLLKRLNTCRARLLKFMLGCVDKVPEDPKMGDGSFILPGDGIQAATELMNSENKYESAAYVGLSIEVGMLQEASNYLASMPYTDEEMLDFRDVQLLNIQYQSLRDSFELSQTERSLLANIGSKSHPLAAYARGLYYQLTGETIYPDIPIKTFTRSKVNKQELEVIYPNPFNDVLTIDSVSETNRVKISDITGRTILDNPVNGNMTQFDTSSWQSGIYIISLTAQDGTNSSYKIVKQ